MTSQEQDPAGDLTRLTGRLWVAVRRFDDVLAFAALDRALDLRAPAEVADHVVAPVLRRLGDSWHLSARMIAVEHFTCQVVRARFQALSSGGPPDGPLALCFSPAGEQHDLGLHLAGAALVAAGWRTRVLGADTPPASSDAAVAALDPQLVVVGACTRPPATAFLASPGARRRPVLVGGGGFSAGDAVDGIVVHDGRFSEVPDVAHRLVEREAAPAGG